MIPLSYGDLEKRKQDKLSKPAVEETPKIVKCDGVSKISHNPYLSNSYLPSKSLGELLSPLWIWMKAHRGLTVVIAIFLFFIYCGMWAAMHPEEAAQNSLNAERRWAEREYQKAQREYDKVYYDEAIRTRARIDMLNP